MSATQIVRNHLVVFVHLFGLLSSTPASGSERVEFNRDIRPILSDHCYACHGPDEKSRKAGLRLDIREPAFTPAKSGAIPLVPRYPAKSELIRRITTDDEDDRMPPAKKGGKPPRQNRLNSEARVAEGAEWQGHWAYPAANDPNPEIKKRKLAS